MIDIDELQEYKILKALNLGQFIEDEFHIDIETRYHIEQDFLKNAERLELFIEVDMLYKRFRQQLLEYFLC